MKRNSFIFYLLELVHFQLKVSSVYYFYFKNLILRKKYYTNSTDSRLLGYYGIFLKKTFHCVTSVMIAGAFIWKSYVNLIKVLFKDKNEARKTGKPYAYYVFLSEEGIGSVWNPSILIAQQKIVI